MPAKKPKSRITAADLAKFRRGLADAIDTIQRRVLAIPAAPPAQLLWLGEFARRHISTDEERTRAADEVMGLLIRHVTQDANAAADAGLTAFVEPADVPAIQAAVRQVLDTLAPRAPVWFPQPITDGLVWVVGGPAGDRVVAVTRTPGIPQVLTAVAALLISLGPKLRRCATPTCHVLFAANRPSQHHCTTSCGSVWRMTQWREKNRDEAKEARHRQYVHRVERKLPGARVIVRKRKKKE